MDEVNISVRKIKNGYIVSKSWRTGKGSKTEYHCEEVFSKTPPDLAKGDFSPKTWDEASESAKKRIDKANEEEGEEE